MNKIKIAVLLLILCLIFPLSLIAQDSEETETVEAETKTKKSEDSYQQVFGLENWQYEYDISGYEKGKYNLIIKGTDRAGNITYEGPINILIDPESDKPIVSISNPTPDMRVGGNLNIVGTCTDDDAVARVEVKIGDGDFQPADGTDFWSYYLATSDMEDGRYAITARGVDVHGTAGEETSVYFQFDRHKPMNSVTSHENGSLVNGKVTLSGTINDKNGIASLEYSSDNGKTFIRLPFKGKRNAPEVTFSLRIDTKKMEDGPRVYWLKSVDKMGSIGVSAFLFFVDNKDPELIILHPIEDMQVNGKFSVIGSAADDIGIESLTWQRGKDAPVDIPLTPGDPYWVQEFDFSGEAKADVIFTLTDRTGNSTTSRLNLKLDTIADLPRVQPFSPSADGKDTAGRLSGFVRDDDGVKEIRYSIDGGEEIVFPCSHVFDIPLPDLESGKHRIDIRAVDIHDLEGQPLRIDFTKVLGNPVIDFATITGKDGGPPPFRQGITCTIGIHTGLAGTIQFSNPPAETTVSVNGGTPVKTAVKKTEDPKVYSFSYTFPKDAAPGYTAIRVTAVDMYGGETSSTAYIQVIGAEGNGIGEEFYVADQRFSEFKAGEKMIRLDSGEEVTALLTGDGTIQSVALLPDTGILTARKTGDTWILTPVQEGIAKGVSILVESAGGSSYTAGPFDIAVDTEPPEFRFQEDLNGTLVREELSAVCELVDNVGTEELLFVVGDREFKPEARETANANALAYDLKIPLSELADGNIVFKLKAVDKAGNSTENSYYIIKDNTPPEIIQTAPAEGTAVNGNTTFAALVEDGGLISSIEFSNDGESFIPITGTRVFYHQVDLSADGESSPGPQFRITDETGNQTLFSPSVTLETETDKPTVQVQIPAEGELLLNDFVISGMAFDDDEVKTIYYRLDEDEFIQLPGGSNFSVPILLADITDNEHTVEVKAEDIGGVMSDSVYRSFVVSKSEPVSLLSAPSIDTTVSRSIELAGESSDANGIDSMFVSLDNGTTFNQMTGAESWKYPLDTQILDDGTHSLLIKARDATGVEGLYTTLINIDNTPPEISLNSPSDGFQSFDTIKLEGRAFDTISIRRLELEISPVMAGGMEAIPEASPGEPWPIVQELPAEEIIFQSMDISDLPPGWYNLKVTAWDRADNSAYMSRNFIKIEELAYSSADILFPIQGETFCSEFVLQGKITGRDIPESAVLFLDGIRTAELEVNEYGYFSQPFTPETITEGTHTLSVEAQLPDGSTLVSSPKEIEYKTAGPWVTFDSITAGDFAADRPWISGRAGYTFLSNGENEEPSKAEEKGRQIESILISTDQGATFQPARGKEEWKYRLETQEYPDGKLNILVRAEFRDGSTAVAKTQIIVDDTSPVVDLLEPEEKMKFNDSIALSGTAEDANGLQDVSVLIRKGDKGRYQVPSFIQGLYLDTNFLGATYFKIGIGLTFFDDNVKLQAQYGLAPDGRFNGHVIGAKLLANIGVLPYGFFFGPGWAPFSSSFAIGAAFDYFTMTGGDDPDATGLFIGSVVGQIELLKWQTPNWPVIKAFSLYTEGQLWFISSDIEGGILAKLAFGLRIQIL